MIGIKKFKNIINDSTCNQLIEYINKNIDQTVSYEHSENNNVVCRELNLSSNSKLDNSVYQSMQNILKKYKSIYKFFDCNKDMGYLLRQISGPTRLHVDGIFGYDEPDLKHVRNLSIIIGLNNNYDEGTFHFPLQKYSTQLKRGEALCFPVYYTFPHSVDKPIGYRYTINTWTTE